MLLRPEAPALCSLAAAAGRKYPYTLEAIQPQPSGSYVGINSALANKIVEGIIHQGLIPELGSLHVGDALEEGCKVAAFADVASFVWWRHVNSKWGDEQKGSTGCVTLLE